MFNLEQIGEKTVSKIAEMALSKQIEQAEAFSVQVKTDPEKLAKGTLESIAIDGRGVIIHQYLRLQEMKITLNHIAVHPFKALMGNIQLTQPSQGTVYLVLTEKDIERALLSKRLSKNLEYKLLTSIFIKQILFRISEQNQLIIRTILGLNATGEIKEVFFKAIPINLNGEFFLEEVEPAKERFSSTVNRVVAQEILQILKIDFFQIEGLSIALQSLTVQPGQLVIQGVAEMIKFPGT